MHRQLSLFAFVFGMLAGVAAPAATFAASDDAVKAAAELGLTAESLVVAGLGRGDAVNEILVRIESAHDIRSAIANARIAVDDAAATVMEMAGAALSHAGDARFAAEYDAAMLLLQGSKQTLSALQAELLEVALSGLPSDAVSRLLAWRVSAALNVPAEMRVTLRTQEQWQAIQAALRAEQRSLRLRQVVQASHAQVLDEVRNEAAVLEAGYQRSHYLNLVTQRFGAFSGSN